MITDKEIDNMLSGIRDYQHIQTTPAAPKELAPVPETKPEAAIEANQEDSTEPLQSVTTLAAEGASEEEVIVESASEAMPEHHLDSVDMPKPQPELVPEPIAVPHSLPEPVTLTKAREAIRRPPLPQLSLYDCFVKKQTPPPIRRPTVSDEVHSSADSTTQEDARLVRPESLAISPAQSVAALENWLSAEPRRKPFGKRS
ncbi:MAG: hypothetical protein WCF85_00435 [Rhodospirillaceae bacterium]